MGSYSSVPNRGVVLINVLEGYCYKINKCVVPNKCVGQKISIIVVKMFRKILKIGSENFGMRPNSQVILKKKGVKCAKIFECFGPNKHIGRKFL